METIIVIGLLLLIFIHLLFDIETFDVIGDSHYPNYIDGINTKMDCCLVTKEYDGNDFKYNYNIHSDEKCDNSLYDSNKQLYIVGEDWNNSYCKDGMLGSCRNVNRECVDFVDKDFCSKYNMVWSKKTCQNPLPYKFKDRIKRILPKVSKGSEILNMFPSNKTALQEVKYISSEESNNDEYVESYMKGRRTCPAPRPDIKVDPVIAGLKAQQEGVYSTNMYNTTLAEDYIDRYYLSKLI
jgi:hypothetical protein